MNSPAKEQQESLQDIIEEQFDKMEAGEAEETVDEEVEVSEEATEEVSEDTSEVSETEEVAEPEQELKEEIEEAAESDYNEPAPERWPDEIREVYDSLPPVARKAMLEGIYKPMQRAYTESTQELSRMRNTVNPMLEAMNQYREDFDRMGVNPVEAFRTQMAWAAHLARVGPEQGLKDMQSAYGLNAPQQGQQTPEQEYLTPAERALKARLDTLEQNWQGQQQQTQADAQRAEQERENAYKQEIQRNLTAFVNEKTEDGSPAHPHVNRVANGIAGVIRGGLVRTADEYGNPISMRDQIAQAYDMACHLDPTVRTQTRQDTGQVKKVQAAQKVDVVAKEPAGQVPVNEDMPIEDFISKTYDQLARR